MAIATTGIAGLCVANANCLGMARAHKETLIVNQCLQQRMESFRSASWSQLSDANAVSVLLSQDRVNNGFLDGQTEKVTINAYPAVTPVITPIVVTRAPNGVTTVVSQPSGFSLRNSLAVQINLQETWTSAQGGRARLRETSTVVALGGLFH